MSTQPLSLTDVIALAATSREETTQCVCCGEDPVLWGVVLLEYEVPQVVAAAWCGKPDCQRDVTMCPTLTQPYPHGTDIGPAAAAIEPSGLPPVIPPDEARPLGWLFRDAHRRVDGASC